MDNLQRLWYLREWRIASHEKHGNAFQAFFESIMISKYGNDFQPIRPYGHNGDKKCDGYLISEKTVYQCYAPQSLMVDSNALRKIKEDFNGAKQYWPEMEAWIFVSNQEHFSPGVFQELQRLNAENPLIRIESLSFSGLKQIAFSLSLDFIIDILGAAPTYQDLHTLQFEDLKPVLAYIHKNQIDPKYPVSAPSIYKLEANNLSSDVEGLLKIGRQRERLVEQYSEPDFGEQIAQSFRQYYQQLKIEDIKGDDVFDQLVAFTAGQKRGTPKEEAAILAIMSYFFERCDIFEDA